jgi:hypothetical protein
MNTKEIPFCVFEGFLKHISLEALESGQRDLLRLAFPGFLPLEDLTPDMESDVAEHLRHGASLVHASLNKPRRFAGDELLSRGRYYSVARADDGNDNRCLANELLAYCDVQQKGSVHIVDPSIDAERDALERLLPTSMESNHIYIVFTNADRVADRVIAPRVLLQNGRIMICWLPYSVLKIRIECCLDLRYPHVRRWFFQTFRKGDGEAFDKPLARDLSSFYELLPTLMYPEIGGGPITTVGAAVYGIGNWMRSHNVGALIYPSARSDAGVQVRGGAIEKFTGWNLLDYRGVEKPLSTSVIDFSDWHRGFPAGVVISVPPDNMTELLGSFQVVGLEAFFAQYREAERGARRC